ncbi:hypothetical protein ABZP36_008686 [Zizania latifolia]
MQEYMLEVLEALRGRISMLMKAGRITDDHGRHRLAFVEMELSGLVERLQLAALPWIRSHGDEWLLELRRDARTIDDFVDKNGDGQVSHSLLQKVARPFRRFKLTSHRLRQIEWHAYVLYRAAEECSGYELRNSDLRPQAAKECDLVGIDGQANKLLIRCLTAAADDDKIRRVMCIVGPTGVGKTTLAMELHRRLRCQPAQHFPCCAAVSFIRTSDRCCLLLRSILSQIIDQETCSPHNSKTIMLEEDPKLLAHSISERLQGKRYLILIDGISNESDWEIIKGAFPNNNCGSRILITTHDDLIIRMCKAQGYDVEVHNMEPLNDSDSDRLLRTKAFGSMDDCPPDNLKPLCDEILRKCEGIPFFIIVMADWLKQHQQQQESSAVHRTEQVGLIMKQFRQILLSFEYDDELRITSLYLSMFPQGRVFDKYHLFNWCFPFYLYFISMLVDNDRRLSLNVDWFEIFSKLVDKNIIIPVPENSSLSLNVDDDESCQWQVNPLMLHFFASKAADTGIAFTSTTLASAIGSSKMTQRARRLALHHPDPQLQGMLQEMDLSHTRSLLISGAVDRISIPLDKFSYLVELDLQDWENLKDEDLLHICNMFMLNYLSVRNTRISKLPPQIRELSNLTTLDVSHTHISELPSEACEVWFLKALHLRGTKISQLPEQIKFRVLRVLDLRGTKISQLPENFKVRLLEVLDLRGTKISQLLPEQFERSDLHVLLVGDNGVINSDETAVVTKIPQSVIKSATSLQTLATVDLSECSASFLEVLGDKKDLRSLAITWSFHQCTDRAYDKILLSTIQKLRKLESLTIHCGLGCSMQFLGSLEDPPMRLRKLKVTAGRFVSVPQWIGRLKQLAFLQITICRLEPADVNILANLKKLQLLVLGLEFIPEKDIVIECDVFEELQRFCLDCPVPWLTFKQGAMPNLHRLQLKICSGPANQESDVPSGLTNLRSITEVVICYSKWCSNSSSIKMTVEAVRKQVAMHPNGIDLVINGRLENDETTGSMTKKECKCEDVEAFGEEAERVAECGTKVDFDAADEVAERRAIHIQSEIEEVECEIEIHT